MKDVGFWGNRKLLSRHESLNTLREAESATLKNLDQENIRMGKTLHQESMGRKEVVAALSCRVYYILRNNGIEDKVLYEVCHREAWT